MGAHNTYLHFVRRLSLKLCLLHLILNLQVETVFQLPVVRPDKFQFLEKGQNGNFENKIVISVKNLKFIL